MGFKVQDHKLKYSETTAKKPGKLTEGDIQDQGSMKTIAVPGGTAEKPWSTPVSTVKGHKGQ